MTQSASGKFPHQFSEEFVRAYEKQIAEYKRLERRANPSNVSSLMEPAANPFEEEELVDQTEDASYADQY